MASYNKVILMGHLTRDPELTVTKNGSSICDFGIAVNEYYNGNERPSFFNVRCFGKTAENCAEYLEKGKAVLLDGKLREERWETAEGDKRSRVVVNAMLVQFLSSGNGNGSAKAQKPKPAADTGSDDDYGDF